MFRTKYDLDKKTEHVSPSGDDIHITYGWIYEDGVLKYVEKERTNLYAKIQAEKDLTDLHAILSRYEAGDDTALDKVEGMYMDTVDLPKNYAELYTAVSRANDIFDNMPSEIKQKYDNNPAMFWKNYGTVAFDDLVNAYRADQYAKYGMYDSNPVNTVNDFEADKKKIVDEFTKEVTNEPKSE